MSKTIPLQELERWLIDEIARAPAESVILAGHFAIYTSGGKAVDLLDGKNVPKGAPAGFIDFTKQTWEAACAALARSAIRSTKLLVLVDDIQFVRPQLNDPEARERLASALAGNYVSEIEIPSYHGRALSEQGLETNRILRYNDRQCLFSERQMRVAFVRRLHDGLLDAGSRDSGLTVTSENGTTQVTDPDKPGNDPFCLVRYGHTSCAGGYFELLAQLHERGVRRLISLVPLQCLNPISVGTSLATRFGAITGLSVTNVVLPELGSGGPATVLSGIS